MAIPSSGIIAFVGKTGNKMKKSDSTAHYSTDFSPSSQLQSVFVNVELFNWKKDLKMKPLREYHLRCIFSIEMDKWNRQGCIAVSGKVTGSNDDYFRRIHE